MRLSVRDIATNLASGEEQIVRGLGLWRGGTDGKVEEPEAGYHLATHHRKDGTTFPVAVSVQEMDYGGKKMLLASCHDITPLKTAAETLYESELRFRQLFEQSSEALFVHDEEGSFIDCNAEACRSVGYSREELLSMRVTDLTSHPIVRDEQKAKEERERGGERGGNTLWQRILAGDPEAHQVVHFGEHERKDGTSFPVEVRLSGVDYGGRKLVLASARDVTERRELEEQLRRRAFHDPLTGLPNRALFMDRLELSLERVRRNPREGTALLFMDLDNFKGVNDRFGHEAGDALLAAVSERLFECVRSGDTVSRFGGDEFAVLLEGAGLETVQEVTMRIERAFAEPFELDRGRTLRVSITVGHALTEAHQRAEEILREADQAMYRRKFRR